MHIFYSDGSDVTSVHQTSRLHWKCAHNSSLQASHSALQSLKNVVSYQFLDNIYANTDISVMGWHQLIILAKQYYGWAFWFFFISVIFPFTFYIEESQCSLPSLPTITSSSVCTPYCKADEQNLPVEQYSALICLFVLYVSHQCHVTINCDQSDYQADQMREQGILSSHNSHSAPADYAFCQFLLDETGCTWTYSIFCIVQYVPYISEGNAVS